MGIEAVISLYPWNIVELTWLDLSIYPTGPNW